MAVERMPDFNEIKNLIGNLEKLDQSFRKITTEYDSGGNPGGGTQKFQGGD